MVRCKWPSNYKKARDRYHVESSSEEVDSGADEHLISNTGSKKSSNGGDYRLGQQTKQKKKMRTEKALFCRCSPEAFHSLSVHILKSAEKTEKVQQIGFRNLLDIDSHTLHHDLCYWLVDRFDPIRSEIKVDDGKVLRVTSKDVALVLGIPGEGEKFVLRHVKRNNPHGPSIRVPLLLLRDYLRDKSVKEIGATTFKYLFVIFALKSLLTPTSRNDIDISEIDKLPQEGTFAKYDWAQHVLDYLCLSLKRYKEGKLKYVGGCLYFLMMFYLDRIDIGPPRVDRVLPRMKVWSNKAVLARLEEERASGRGFGYGLIRPPKGESEVSAPYLARGLPNFLSNHHRAEVVDQAQKVGAEFSRLIEMVLLGPSEHDRGPVGDVRAQTLAAGYDTGVKVRQKRQKRSNIRLHEQEDNSSREQQDERAANETCAEEAGVSSFPNLDAHDIDKRSNDVTKDTEKMVRNGKGLVNPDKGKTKPVRTVRRSERVQSRTGKLWSRAHVSDGMNIIAEYCWNKDYDAEEKLVDMNDLCLRRRDMCSLSDGKRILTTVVNMVARVENMKMGNQQIKRYIFDAVLGSALKKYEFIGKAEDDVITHFSWYFDKEKTKIDLSSCDLLLIPLRLNGHWRAYTVNVHRKTIELLDWKSAGQITPMEAFILRLKRVFTMMFRRFYREANFDVEQYSPTRAAVPCLSPNNVNDCGVFLIKYLQHWYGQMDTTIIETEVHHRSRKIWFST